MEMEGFRFHAILDRTTIIDRNFLEISFSSFRVERSSEWLSY